jgi:hypothetical protein
MLRDGKWHKAKGMMGTKSCRRHNFNGVPYIREGETKAKKNEMTPRFTSTMKESSGELFKLHDLG